MNFLILGGSGFIGSGITERISRRNDCYLTVFDMKPPAIDRNNITFIEGKFQESTDFIALTKGVDIVFHCISTTSPRNFHGMKNEFLENLLPTISLLDACVENKVKKVIFLSSGGTVYGDNPNRIPAREDAPCRPICPYGVHKHCIEQVLEVYYQQYGLSYTVARIGNPYGPGQNTVGVGVISAFLKLLLKNEPIHLIGDGSIIRDYIYSEDLFDALVSLSDYNGSHRIFNVSSGEGHSVRDIIYTISDVLHITPEIISEPASSNDVAYNVLDISLLRQETGFQPHYSLRKGITEIIKQSRH